MRFSNRRTGYTLVEILVVITIVAVLIALLIPAVQRVRRAANMTHCQNNLKQIGVAAHGYASTYGALPPGSVGVLNWQEDPRLLQQEDWRNPYVTALAFLLPYLEQENVYQMIFAGPEPVPADFFSIATSVNKSWWEFGSARLAAEARIPTFLCPADDIQEATVFGFPAAGIGEEGAVQWAGDDFVHWAGPPAFYAIPVGKVYSIAKDWGRTNYLASSGYAGRRSWWFALAYGDHGDYEGVMSTRSKLSLASIAGADGTSNTLMFGEAFGQLINTGSRIGLPTWLGASSLETIDALDANKWNGYIAGNQYASKHDGLVNFCFADCSVRAIRTTCDYDTFAKYMGGWRDGKVVDFTLAE